MGERIEVLERFLKVPQRTRMFNFITISWNPVIGCLHNCKYCWAKRLAETKLSNLSKYKEGFKPKLIEKELSRKFSSNEFVFVSSMGDLFGDWVPKEWILRVLNVIRSNKQTYFLLLTKNPKRYLEFLDEIPENCILGATIETNRDTSKISKAPVPKLRVEAMRKISEQTNHILMVSIEPVMDFDLEEFVEEIKSINPYFVVIGKNSMDVRLPEPSAEKLVKFKSLLNDFTKVILKKGI